MTRGLADISVADLGALRDALQRGELDAPLTPARLAARGVGHLTEALRPYLTLDRAGLTAVVDVVLAEREHHRAPEIRLVWTGEDPAASLARHTRLLLPELFAAAREHVLLAGYSFDRIEDTFGPLHAVMKERGVTATFFVDVGQLELRLKDAARRAKADWHTLTLPLKHTSAPADRGAAVIDLFRRLLWTFGAPFPTVYFDPRTAARKPLVSMHAKCVVIDHATSLLTSANFTARGQTRNVEAGVVIADPAFARALERQWQNLIDASVVVAG